MQNITAGYVLSRYATKKDVVDLKWLPIKELFEWNTVKLVHKSRFDPMYPEYLKVDFHIPRRNVRSEDQEPLVSPGETKTFQAQAQIFDNLPTNFKTLKDYEKFSNETKKFYLDQALAESLSP